MFSKFPRDVGPPRIVAHNQKEYFDYINLYNGKKKAVFTSIYSFKKVRVHGREVPDYETVDIDKIFFDFDDKSCNAYENCLKLHTECLRLDLAHTLVFSGRGYHLYIYVQPHIFKHKKDAIKNAQLHFIDNLKIIVDRQVVGNPAQMARVPNTYNVKGRRFCIPLTREQFEKGDAFIKQFAEKQNFITDLIIGKNRLDISRFDISSNNMQLDFETPNVEGKEINVTEENVPPCIKLVLSNPDMGYNDRYLVITFFRDRGYFMAEIRELLKKYLSQQKFYHCVVEERQLQYLYNRHDLIFPSCAELKRRKRCTGKCQWVDNVVYK